MIPDAGDIHWVELDPILGTEQAGRRPALILSTREYHAVSLRTVVCPITSARRAWPFHVALPVVCRTRGYVLVDQVRTIDRSIRMFAFIEAVPRDCLAEVRAHLAALLGM